MPKARVRAFQDILKERGRAQPAGLEKFCCIAVSYYSSISVQLDRGAFVSPATAQDIKDGLKYGAIWRRVACSVVSYSNLKPVASISLAAQSNRKLSSSAAHLYRPHHVSYREPIDLCAQHGCCPPLTTEPQSPTVYARPLQNLGRPACSLAMDLRW